MSADGPARLRRLLPHLGLAIGAWALIPPYTGPYLNTAARVEVVDHLVPGVLVLVVSVLSLRLVMRESTPALSLLVAGMTVALAGLWMTLTHIPLVAQAANHEAAAAAAAYHTAPGLAVLALGVIWAKKYWSDAN